MSNLELWYRIISEIYYISTMLLTSYCLMIWIKPFFPTEAKIWLVGFVYLCTMTVLNYMPWYLSAIAAYLLGVMIAFVVMCLIDPAYISQKLFLAATFFCLRWQAWRIVGGLMNAKYSLSLRLFPTIEDDFWIWLFTIDDVLDALTGFLLLYGSIRFLLHVYDGRREPIKIREFLILIMPSVSSICSYCLIRFYNDTYIHNFGRYLEEDYPAYNFLVYILYPVICYITILAMVYLFRQWKNELEEDMRKEIFSKQLQDLESHITEAERLYQDIRNLRHDMGNHLMTLKQLYEQGEYNAAQQYTDKLGIEMAKTVFDINSGNPVTDVILSGRKKEMDEKDISFICDFHYPMTETVDSFDISIILNNALSNAIEAIEREKDGAEESRNPARIFLSSNRRKNMYLIEVANNYKGELKIDKPNDLPRTSKNDEGHGFGLAAIRHAAHKYLGDIEIAKENREGENYFVLRVMLQLPEKEQERFHQHL